MREFDVLTFQLWAADLYWTPNSGFKKVLEETKLQETLIPWTSTFWGGAAFTAAHKNTSWSLKQTVISDDQ